MSIAFIVLRLHDVAQRLFGTMMEAAERKKKVADLLIDHQGYLRICARQLAIGTVLDERDLVQNTCRRVLEIWHQWQGPAFEPWLRQILQTVFLQELRREKLRTPTDITDAAWARVEDQQAGTAVDAVVMGLDAAKTMSYLSPDHQEILLLAMKDFSHQELADAIGIPKGTVMSRLKRARDQYKRYASMDQGRKEARV